MATLAVTTLIGAGLGRHRGAPAGAAVPHA